MSLREQLSKYPKTAAAVSTVVLLFSLFLVWQSLSATSNGSAHFGHTYFSDDDGATFFADDVSRVIELQRRDKPAYMAVVYSCDPSGGRRFVGYLTRYTAQSLDAYKAAKADAEAARAQYPINDPRLNNAEERLVAAQNDLSARAEVKRPGANNKWVPSADPAGAEIVADIKCPDGASGTPQAVTP